MIVFIKWKQVIVSTKRTNKSRENRLRSYFNRFKLCAKEHHGIKSFALEIDIFWQLSKNVHVSFQSKLNRIVNNHFEWSFIWSCILSIVLLLAAKIDLKQIIFQSYESQPDSPILNFLSQPADLFHKEDVSRKIWQNLHFETSFCVLGV